MKLIKYLQKANIPLVLIYALPVIIVTALRIKTDQMNDGSLNFSFLLKFYLTAVIADFGAGYYFSRFASRFFKPAVFVCSFIFWFIAFANILSFVLTYNLPTESIFITVFDTTYHHTMDFFQTVPFVVYIGIFLYWSLWFYLGKAVKKPPFEKGDGLFYGFLFIAFGALCFFTQWERSFFYNARQAWQAYSDLKQEISSLLQNEKQADFKLNSPETPRTIIIAVGESSNRRVFNENIKDFKEKTAFLKNPPLIINDATATSVSTAYTLKNVLLPHNISLISVYKEAGFKTFWFSNHFKSGKDDNLIYALTRNIDDRRYFNHTKSDVDYEYTSQYYDEILLSPLKDALADPAPRKIIFLHLFGSHFPYVNRYPNATETLITEQYAGSVRYTSTVLAEALKLIENSGQNSAFLYFSDHGTIPANPFSRPSKGDDMLNIPMFFWVSDRYQKQDKDINRYLACLSDLNTAKIPFIINLLSELKIKDLPIPADIQKCFSAQ